MRKTLTIIAVGLMFAFVTVSALKSGQTGKSKTPYATEKAAIKPLR